MRVDLCCRARGVAAIVCLLLTLAAAGGCGQSRPPVALASGRVVCQGEPVSGGSITFMPMPPEGQGGKEPGKAAKGEVSEDGSFRLTTFDTFDGAVVGRHRVSYESPEGGEEEDAEAVSESEEEAAPSRQKKAARPVYHIQGELLVEVKAGEANTFVVEVVPGADRSEEE